MDAQKTGLQRLVRARGGYHAFVPAPLPPKLAYGDDLVLGLSRADAALSELAGLGRHLPNPHLLIAPYVRREAVLSSRIEGTTTSLAELLLDEVAEGATGRDPHDVQEVRNYVTALGYGVTRLKTLPLSLRLVRELHARLMKGDRKSTRLNSSHLVISYAVFCLKKKKLTKEDAPSYNAT